jgi:hypothetical protein
MVCAAATAGAQPARATEEQIKAAYLFSFGKFIDWPANAAASDGFYICVLGRDPFGPTLDEVLKNASVAGQRVVGRRIDAAEAAAGCRIVYVSASEAQRLDALLPALGRAGALTVSDIPDFIDRGGMIRFVPDGKRVRFEINLPPAQEAGLVLRSDLLRVAAAVHK